MTDTTSNPTRLGDCHRCGCSVYQGCYHSCPTGITAWPSGQVCNAEPVLYPLEPSQRIAALESELSACRSQVAGLLETLSANEWKGQHFLGDDGPGCPACTATKSEGHATGCWLAAALASSAPLDPEKLAQKFHEAYERLAPQFGYETRKASAKPWAEVPENNRKLMTVVCAEILKI